MSIATKSQQSLSTQNSSKQHEHKNPRRPHNNNKFNKTRNLMTQIKNATKALLFSDRLYEPRNIDRIIVHCRLSDKLEFQNLVEYWDSTHDNREGRSILS